MKNYIKKIISLQITTSLFLQQTLIANNLAVDTTAPKNNQANIEKARNGVPVVNIVAPTQSGLSHNKFSDYNVNKDGLILNNSNKQEVNTQLAGYIYGNENLRNGTAKTILNEVTSKNRTYLKGFTEVAGDRASVVVANPNGIYINGAGFINTYKATITTGNPNIINQELRGFDIKTGQIDIDGGGLNVSNVNKAELYAKTVSLNAKIYAQNLDVVTGENKILQDGTIKNIEDVVKEKPLLSLDSSSLGGIYANKISLIGTQKGVGVNLPIEIIAQDSLVLSADGKIFLDKVSSEKDVEIASKNDSINTNIVYANSINMEAKNDITNEELIIAQNSISLKANDIVNKNAIATLNKDIDITAKNLTNYNTIYSNDSVNLYLEDTLLNSTNSSVVDLANEKATIEAKNSISIKANRVINDKAIIKTQNKNINIEAFSLENLAGNPNIKGSYIQSGNSKSIQNGTRINTQTIARDRAGYAYNSYNIYTDIMEFEDYDYSSIISGRDMNLTSGDIKNNYSLIFAQNNINIEANTLANISTDIVKLVTTHKDIYVEKKKKHKMKGGKAGKVTRSSQYSGRQTTYNVEVIDSVNSTIQAGGKIFANLDKLENGMLENKTLEFDTYNSFNSSLFKNIPLNKDEEGNYKLPTNRYSLFTTTNPNKNPEYLVESNPLYTNYDNYIGSSYFFDKVGYSQDRKIKRLGDAAYETKLVSDAIFRLTGQRSLNLDFQNENEQFVVLMENAVNLSGILELELGKPLSKEQIDNLTEDIVWMEEQIVNGQIVLVPVVYLAKDYKTKGASIVANNIDLDIKDSLNSSGTIKSNQNMNVKANSITNNSGVLLSRGKATLISNEDFINKNGGQIKGDEIAIASLNGSVINETYSNTYTEDSVLNKRTLFGTKQVKNGDFTNTEIGKTSTIEATNGNLVIQAKEDITNIGANLKAENNVILKTQDGDINLNAIKLEQGHNLNFSGGFDKSKDVEYQTSDIEANNIIMQSGKDINLQASKLKAKEDINLSASNDVNVEALNNEYYRDRQITTKGFMSKKTTRDMEYKESVNSSEFDAENIYISSGNDVNLQATKLKAKDNIVVDADNSINILAKEYKEGSLHQTNKSSWGGLKKSLDIESTDALKLNSALLETEASNIVLNSGKDINILASEINSAGDIQLKALEDILIASQSEYLAKKEVHEKSSFNLAGLVSLIVPVETTLYSQEISKNDKVNSTNVSSSLNAKNDIKIDSGSTTIVGSNLEANSIDIKADTGEINIVSSQDLENMSSFERKIEVGLSDITSVIKDQYKDLMKGDTKLKFEVGSAEFNEVDKASQKVTNNASNLKARESINLDSLSDINIVGSNLQSEENITLSSSVGDVNILSSTDSYSQNIDEKQASAKLSLTVQNEYVEIAQAVDSAVKSAEQLKQTKDDYSNYKSEVKKLENTLSELKQSYKNGEVGIDYEDIEDLNNFIDNLKSQEKYYLAAISSATADLASKTTAIATQTATAAASSGTLGFSVGLSLDVDGSKTNTNTSTTSSNSSNLVSNSITINTKEDTNIIGSNLVANDSLNINTTNLNVKASQDTTSIRQDSESLNGSVNFTMYGGGGGTASLGGGKQSFQSDSVVNNNSQLLANNVNIDVKNDANFIGANVRAEDTLNLNVGNNLIVESLRDEYSTNQSGFNVNAGIGLGSGGKESHRAPSTDIGKVSSANAGLSMNNGVSQSKQTVLSSITGNEVNINVDGNTHLKGSLISSDEDNLNFTTNTLTFANLSNSSYSSSKTIGGSVSSNVKGDVSNLGYNSENSLEANASKTLATLGNGNITIKDIENSDDLTKLNQDVNAINKDLYSSQTGTKVDATLDTRLLTEEGRKEIKDDIYTASAIAKAIEQIVTTDKASIVDFFDETQQNVDVYNAMKTKIANSDELSKYLQDPNLDPLVKQNMLQEIASTVMQELGYTSNEVKIISTDETGTNNTQVKGYYDPNTNISYVNDKYNNSTSELVSSTGHEIMHDMDKQNNIFVANDKDQNIYATNFGDNLAYYTDGALNIVNGGNLASTNNHNLGIVTEYPSVFNTNNLLTGNNKEFAGLDKNNGDDLPIIPIVILGVSAFQTYLNTPTNENDIHRGIEGEIDKNMNQPMKKVINKSEEVINQFGEDLNTLYIKRDDIAQDISSAYRNMPDWARKSSIDIAMTITEYGSTVWLPKPILNSYDIYSGQNFDTYPTSIWGGIGYGNDKLIEYEKNKNNEK